MFLIFVIMIIITGGISIILLSGRGSFLIAGYNTASRKEKAQYDEKKLCRVTGGGMGVITLLLLLMLPMFSKKDYSSGLFWICGIGIFIITIVTVGLSNTICKVKNPPDIQETEEDQKRAKRVEKGAWIFTIVILAAVGIFLSTGSVTVQTQKDALHITATYWKGMTIDYNNIESVEYVENLNLGQRNNGLGSFKLELGNFKNSSFGNYTLYSYMKCKSYVVLQTTEGMVVLNTKNAETTKNLYQDIRQQMEMQNPTN